MGDIVRDYENTIFCSAQGRVRAINTSDPSNPTTIWDKRVNKGMFSSYKKQDHYSHIIIDDDKYIYTSGRTHLYKMNSTDGSIIWRSISLGPYLYSPTLTIFEDKLITVFGHVVYAISKEDGSIVWSYDMEGRRKSYCSYVIKGSKMYVAFCGFLIGIDAKTGKEFWRLKLTKSSWEPTCIAHNDNPKKPLLFLTLKGKLYVFCTHWRRRIKTKTVSKNGDIVSILLHKKNLYLGYTRKILALKQKDLAVRWERSLDSTCLTVSMFLAEVGGENVLFAATSEGRSKVVLYSLRTTGSKRWQDFSTRAIARCTGTASIVAKGDVICIGSSGGTITTINPVLKQNRGKINFGYEWIGIAATDLVLNPNSQPLAQESYFIKNAKKNEDDDDE